MTVGILVFPSDCTIPQQVRDSCASNFSENYGIWQDRSKGRVKMSSKMLAKNYFGDPQCRLAISFDGAMENVVGHVFYKVFSVGGILDKDVVWITQLVVSSQYRHQKIAQNLIHAVIGTSCECVGLVTSHPYAVLAVEKAMGVKASRAISCAVAADIIAASGVSYLIGKPLVFNDGMCLINTEFFVDHDEPQTALDSLSGWRLGPLLDGHEFVVVTMK